MYTCMVAPYLVHLYQVVYIMGYGANGNHTDLVPIIAHHRIEK